MKKSKITEDHIDLIHAIEMDSKASQRQIAKKTGLSIGKVKLHYQSFNRCWVH